MNMPEAMTPTTSVDGVLHRLFNTPEGRADPYALYRELQEAPPVLHSERDGLWYTCRHEICHQVLLDQRMGHIEEEVLRRPGGLGEEERRRLDALLARRRRRGLSMATENPPNHTRLRRLVSRAFTFRRVEALRPRIIELVDACLDRFAAAGEVDVMAELAFPLPVSVIGDLLGVPPEDRERFRSLVRDATSVGDRPELPQEELDRAEASLDEMERYFTGLIAQRQAHPRDDLLSALIGVRDEEEGALSEDELLALAFVLFLAGFITTTNLIGNGLLALLRHPDEMQRLWTDGGLVISAVEEMLRYDPPVQVLRRETLVPMEIEDVSLAAGESLILMLGAANRDPRRFLEPDRFDVGRADNHHLSFGSGIHHCLGAPLARAEGQVVFARLRERFAGLDLCDPEPPLERGFFRGRTSVMVAAHSR
jgi:cytochrome P450